MTHCSRRGDCVLGFCHCHEGFFGVDCSLTMMADDGRVQRQRWWEDADLSSQSGGQPWWEQPQDRAEAAGENTTAVQQATWSARSLAMPRPPAQRATTESGGAPAAAVMQSAAAERPKTSPHAASPTVYVYDLPPVFNVHFLPGSPLHHKVKNRPRAASRVGEGVLR